MSITHSKYKNTGLLFEVLTKQITSDTLSGKNSKALKILKKYFVNTELGKEYKLYELLTKYNNISPNKANVILETILESSKKLNRNVLRKEKYNLIKEISENYDINSLFKIKINNYSVKAALCVLMEIYNNSQKETNPIHIINNKTTILESLTKKEVLKDSIKNDLLEEYKNYDKGTRILTYKILIEKFNQKYSNLNHNQKNILKEIIESVDSTTKLKDFYNKEVSFLQKSFKPYLKTFPDLNIKIKLNEIFSMIKVLDKQDKLKDTHILNILQFHSLLEEIKNNE